MANSFQCDICTKTTYINPPSEPQWEEHKVEVSVPYTEDVPDPDVPSKFSKVLKYKNETQITRLPKLTKMRRQNAQTGEVEEVPIQDIKDLQPRAYLIRLMVGNEVLQKDFCKECLETIMPQIQALWDKMASIKSIE